MNPIKKLSSLGQSIWYDNIQRKLLENGELKAMIDRGDIRGVTSNPSIFNHAIAKSTDYDSALTPLVWAGWDAEKIFWQLAIEDIKAACDAFAPLYEETNGSDGYVSIEVSPHIANDTDATVAQAEQLWVRVARPNLMVKIPATKAGIPAIRKAIAAGVNVNVTLIFSLKRYAEVMDAYLSGLEDRDAAGHPIDHIASVASFFVSRVDSKIDPKLPGESHLRGKAAIANAKLAYDLYHQTFAGRRWENLKVKSARVQRPLWASTSTKNPAYPDTLYVDELVGPETVNTVPPQTLEAFRDHGTASMTLMRGLAEAKDTVKQLETLGISMGVVTQELEEEGIKSFADAFDSLLKAIDSKAVEVRKNTTDQKNDKILPKENVMDLNNTVLINERIPDSIFDSLRSVPEKLYVSYAKTVKFDIPQSYLDYDVIEIVPLAEAIFPVEFVSSVTRKEIKTLLHINRENAIPAFVGSKTLVILCGPSDSSEELLSLSKDALSRSSKVIVMVYGVEVSNAMSEISYLVMKEADTPETIFTSVLGSLLGLFANLGAISDKLLDIQLARETLAQSNLKFSPLSLINDNRAKEIASRLHSKMPIILASNLLGNIADRWKFQLQLYGNVIAKVNIVEFDDMDSTYFPLHGVDTSTVHVIALRDFDDPKRWREKLDIMRTQIESENIPYVELYGEGTTILGRLLNLGYLLDYISLYLAFLYN